MICSKKVAVILISVCLLGSGCLKVRGGKQGTADARNFTVGKKAYRHLSKASELVAEKRYDDALEEMERMKRREYFNDHEQALMWQQIAGILAVKGKYQETARCMEKILALNALPERSILDTQFNLAGLYLSLGEYHRAMKLLTKWIKRVENPEPKAYYVLATAYAQVGRFAQALPYAQKAVNRMKKEEKSWLQLLLSIHFELKQNDKLEKLLKRMIQSFPDEKNYWLQLSALYANMEKNDEALAVLELAYVQNMLSKQSEYISLANLYMTQGIAVKAVQLIEKELKSGRIGETPHILEVYANALLLSREDKKALNILAESAKESNNGELYLQMARIYIDQQRWGRARTILEKALRKAKFASRGNAYLLLGIAYYNSNRIGTALAAFEKAKQDGTTRRSADRWIKIARKSKW